MPRAQGHDLRAVAALSRAIDCIMHRLRGRKVLVVSGDASARGSDNQLGLYRTLFDTGWQPDLHTMIPSLKDGFDSHTEIPGNHDYWGGFILNPRLNLAIRGRYFPHPPRPVIVDIGRYTVALHGLCSTAGSSPIEQVLAVGGFDDQDLVTVEKSLRSVSSTGRNTPFHLVVTHHSPSGGSRYFHGLSAIAHTTLLQLSNRFNVRGLLTGHTHCAAVVDRSVGPAEVRCATTVQANIPPFRRQARKFYLHELRAINNQLQWHVTPWVFDRVSGFREVRKERRQVAY